MRVIKEKWSRHVVRLFITCETGLSEKMAYLETIIREQSLRQEYQIECKNIKLRVYFLRLLGDFIAYVSRLEIFEAQLLV